MTDKTSSNGISEDRPDQEPNISDFYLMGLLKNLI